MRSVDEERGWFYEGEVLGVDEIFVVVGEYEVNVDDVGCVE